MPCAKASFLFCVEVGENTSTVALRVVRGDRREPSARGYNWDTLFLGDINTGTWPSRLEGVTRIGSIKYGLESHETALARTSSKQ
jgi:hypothetical protein